MGWRRKGLEGNIHGDARTKACLDAALGMQLPALFFIRFSPVLWSSISRRGEGRGIGEPHSETGELLASKGRPAPRFCPGAIPTVSLLQFPPLPPESRHPFLSQTCSGPATAISGRKDAFRAHPFCFLAFFSTPTRRIPVTQRPLEMCSQDAVSSSSVLSLYGLVWLPTSAHPSSAIVMVRVTLGSHGATPTACFSIPSSLDEAPSGPF